jgi:hypothetical protein
MTLGPLHSVGALRYRGTAMMAHTVDVIANTYVQSHGWPTSRAFENVGIVTVRVPRICMQELETS